MPNKSASFLPLAKGLIFLCMFFVVACRIQKPPDKDFLYFQKNLDSMKTIRVKEPVIQKNDLLIIQVFTKSLNQEQALPFNMPVSNGKSTGPGGYMVEMNGNVELPIIGPIKAAGLTKLQLQSTLTEKLSSYIKEPSVLIRFSEFKINVLGEVKSPGTHNFERDRVTIIDAISGAGDLTDYGKREDITVIREETTGRKYYKLDLTSGAFFQSPAYELQPNDIVYVGATARKIKSLNTNNESQKGLQFTLGITSIVTAIITIITLTK